MSRVVRYKLSQSANHSLFNQSSAWTALKEIDHLSTAQIQAYIDSPSKKKGDLLNAYKVAADPLTWINERDEAQNAWDALNNAEPVDQLASGDEAAGTSKTAAKKRKRKSDGGESEKPAKESKKKSTSEDKSGKKAKPEKNSKGQVSFRLPPFFFTRRGLSSTSEPAHLARACACSIPSCRAQRHLRY